MPDVVGLGLACVDYIFYITRAPGFGYTVHTDQFEIQGGGPVGTALVTLARLGASAGYVGKSSRDLLGQQRIALLAQEGVDVSQVVWDDKGRSGLAVVLVDAQSGERGFLGAADDWSPLAPQEIDRAYVTSARYLHLDTVGTVAGEVAEWMHQAGRQVVLDGSAINEGDRPKPRHVALLDQVDILIAARTFAWAVTGTRDDGQAARALLNGRTHTVVMTMGEEGALCVTPTQAFHMPAFRVPVVDTTGCGDVFHGAFIYGLLQAWDLRRTTRFANAAAALKARRLGGRAGIPTLAEVEAFLAARTSPCP